MASKTSSSTSLNYLMSSSIEMTPAAMTAEQNLQAAHMQLAFARVDYIAHGGTNRFQGVEAASQPYLHSFDAVLANEPYHPASFKRQIDEIQSRVNVLGIDQAPGLGRVLGQLVTGVALNGYFTSPFFGPAGEYPEAAHIADFAASGMIVSRFLNGLVRPSRHEARRSATITQAIIGCHNRSPEQQIDYENQVLVQSLRKDARFDKFRAASLVPVILASRYAGQKLLT